MDKDKFKVLLIEDNPGDAFLIKFYLEESTVPLFEIFHAETIKQAYELLDQHSFDIVLQDLNLPDSHGVDSIKNLLEKYPNNLVLVLTGLTDEEVGLETVRYGAQDFLVKGKFDGKVLISSVIFAYERYKLTNSINKFTEETEVRKVRFNHLQQLLKIGVIEIYKHEDKAFISNYCKQSLQLNNSELYISKSALNTYFNSFPEDFTNLPQTTEIESKSGVKAMINFTDFEDFTMGIVQFS